MPCWQSVRSPSSDKFIAGRPITKWGWMSSRFGLPDRSHSMASIAWHSGVDFAGKDGVGCDLPVAAGVVTWSGDRSGYGQTWLRSTMVPASSTRYAHNK